MSNDPFSDKAAEQFLSGGAVAVKFPREGFKWGGTVLSWEMSQQTDPEDGELKFWPDGKPKMQLIITMQGEPTGLTWETNSYKEKAIPDDDGMRRLYVKGALQFAVSKALRESGGRLEEGAYLEVQRGKDGPAKKKGWGGPHSFTAVWTPAAKNPKYAAIKAAEGADFLNEGGSEDNPFA